jgi:EmrB/QacA subfamily drug resistance transporter
MSIASTVIPPTRDARWLALAVLCTGTLMIVLDATIVNVALPAIQRDLGFTQSSLAWVVNAYLIAFGGVLLLAGRLGDLLGRRRIFLVGLTVFTLASFACGVSQNGATLIVARFVQGVGGAMTSAVILGMIVTMFTEPRERTRAISLYSFVAAAGASIGLLAGGLLTEALNWHWIFFVNVPIGIVTGLLAARLIEDDEGLGIETGADAIGAILITGALMLGVLTIIRTSDVGWFSVETLATGAAAALALTAFVVREHRTEHPILPLGIFRSRAVTVANAVMVLVVAGFFGTFFIGSLYLQRVLGFDALATGLGFLPVSVSIGVMSFAFAEPLITRFGPLTVLRGSLVLLLVAMLWFARLPVSASYVVDVAPSLFLIGTGAGLAFPSIVGLAMSGATNADAGVASGLVNTTRMVGGSLGLAAMASVATTRAAALVATGADGAAALTGGSQLALALAAALIAVAIVVAWTVARADRLDAVGVDADAVEDVEVFAEAA